MATPYAEMKKWEPDGYMISNGPGDPAAMPGVVETVKQILNDNIPLFGICLGIKIFAFACEFLTYKMLKGLRGLNNLEKNILKGKCEKTSQINGFSVRKKVIVKEK